MGWPPSSFCWAAASPRFCRRLRRRRMAAALPCRRSLRCRRELRGRCEGGWWRGAEGADVGVGGVQVEVLATSAEVGWRWPRAGIGGSWGCAPGRWCFFAFRSSSPELVATAARVRLRAWSSPGPSVSAAGGGILRRLRRRRPRVLAVLDVEEGVLQRCCSLFSLWFFFACIWLCTAFVSV